MIDKINVLYVSHFSTLDGAPRSMINLICDLRNHGIRSYVIIPDRGDIEKELRKNNIKYFVIKYKNCFYDMTKNRSLCNRISNEIFNIEAIYNISKVIRNLNIDIVHSNSFAVDVGASAAYLSGCPHVWHVREFMEEDFGFTHNFKKKDIFLARKSNQIIAVSDAVNKKYTNRYRLKNITTVYNGFPVEQYRVDKNSVLDKEVVEILISGNICKTKGQREAIFACKELIRKGYTNFKLNIAGKGDRDYISYLKSYVDKNEMKDCVKFIGFQNNMRSLRSKMDIELVCSAAEAFGRVTIEAMLSELLVIGSNTGGTKELITDQWNGILYQQGNYKDLADKIEDVLNNRKKYEDIIKHGKNMAIDTFVISNTTRKVLNIYNRVKSK